MNNISLDLSEILDRRIVTMLRQVIEITEKLEIDCVVIGASARDMVLHHGYGAKIKRATMDIEFGMHVHDWPEF